MKDICIYHSILSHSLRVEIFFQNKTWEIEEHLTSFKNESISYSVSQVMGQRCPECPCPSSPLTITKDSDLVT